VDERVVIREVETEDVTAELRARAESCREEGDLLDAAFYFALAGDMAEAGDCFQRGAGDVAGRGGGGR
jgi:hypothetical protein